MVKLPIPVYEAYIGDEQDGLLIMSLVEYPATDIEWQAYSKDDKKQVKFSVDEDRHLLRGVVMLADTLIYRVNGDYEYYIKYTKETLEKMAEKMLSDHTFNTVDIEHDHNMLGEGDAELRELFIKDVEKGINPVGFENVPDGSLLCTYHIENEDIWRRVKNGEFRGFSLEGLFSIKEAEDFNKHNKKKENKMSKIAQLKELLREILVEFSTVKTKDGIEIEVGSEELAEGVAVKAEDGKYELEDGRIIEVAEGVIVSIEEAKAEEKPVEEPKEEEPVEEPKEEEPEEPKEEEKEEPVEDEIVVEEIPAIEQPTQEEVEEIAEVDTLKANVQQLEARLGAVESMVQGLREYIDEIVKKPVVEPIRDEYTPITQEYNKWGLKK